MTTIKPSQVDLTYPHFIACAGRSEREAALGVYVRACQVKGDAWQPLVPRDMGEVLKADREAKLDKLTDNPFWFPDFPDLVKHGYARWLGEGRGAPVELTDLGFEAIDKWVAKVGLVKTEAPTASSLMRAAQPKPEPERSPFLDCTHFVQSVFVVHDGRRLCWCRVCGATKFEPGGWVFAERDRQ